MEAHLVDNRDKYEFALSVAHLAFEKWRKFVIDKMADKLVDACLNLIELMRSGELLFSTKFGLLMINI